MESKYSSNGRGSLDSSKSTSSSGLSSSSSGAKLTQPRRNDMESAQHKYSPQADAKTISRGSDYVSPAKKTTTAKEITDNHHNSHRSSPSTTNRLSFADEKQALIEIQEVIEADEEFEKMKNTPTTTQPKIAKSPFARRFVRGFTITSMSMRDALTGRLIWRSTDWDVDEMFENELREDIPKEILKCRVVSREINFTSAEEMTKFRLEQRVYFKGACIEEWFFTFGYVMAGSRNSWQQTIDAAPPNEMLPPHVLSGNVVFETSFYDNDEFLCKNSVRIYYV